MSKYDTIKGQIAGLKTDKINGTTELVLSIDKESAELINLMADELREKNITITIEELKKKRSLDANGYAWVLMTKIAEKTGITKEEVYFQTISLGNDYAKLYVRQDALRAFVGMWESRGLGWPCKLVDDAHENFKLVHAYYGSSTYNTKQMSDFINRLLSDCKALNIPTISDEELESMLMLWNYGKQKASNTYSIADGIMPEQTKQQERQEPKTERTVVTV